MTIPKRMSGVQLTAHGGPDVLIWNDDIEVPQPGPSEVLVRVLAAGVNNTDINTRIGWYSKTSTDGEPADDDGGWSGALDFPRIQGADLCGYVVARGEGISGFPLGARVTCPTNQPRASKAAPTACEVIGSEYDGAFAQFCKVAAADLYDVTASPLSDTEIAALPCAFGTAENLLARAGVSAGDRVLITGASGGVGLAAVQLAQLRGAVVTGITSPAKADAVRAAGAAQTLPRDGKPEPGYFDVVIDVVGGPAWSSLIEALRPGGSYAVAGAIAGPIVEADLRTVYLNDLTLFGCTYQSPEVFAHLVELINSATVRPLVSKTYPLRDIATAQEDFLSKRYPGKLVLIPPEINE